MMVVIMVVVVVAMVVVMVIKGLPGPWGTSRISNVHHLHQLHHIPTGQISVPGIKATHYGREYAINIPQLESKPRNMHVIAHSGMCIEYRSGKKYNHAYICAWPCDVSNAK